MMFDGSWISRLSGTNFDLKPFIFLVVPLIGLVIVTRIVIENRMCDIE